MVDTTIATNPPAQDLQINLEEAPKQENIPTTENNSTELDLNLDLNLPDAPKDDDRLQKEDQKNSEIGTENEITAIPEIEPIMESTAIIEEEIKTPIINISTPIIEQTTEQIIQETQEETPTDNKTIETVQPILEISTPEIVAENEIISAPTIENKEEVQAENTTNKENTPATIVEEIPQSSNRIGENVPENFCLDEDVKMIEELEGHKAADLNKEDTTREIQAEIPKTFDLDAMLGNPTIPTTREIPQVQVPQTIENNEVQPAIIASVVSTPMIPNTTKQVPIQAILQTSVPHKKNTGVKVFLFLTMFLGLGFATFFILKTMYPIEFGNMIGGENTTIISETSTGEELTGIELTTTENTGLDMSGIAMTGSEQISDVVSTGIDTHASATGDSNFGELNDLVTTDPEPLQNDVSKLTDYVNQGNTFLTQGKTINNNTVIKYGLYISKKATTFLEDIANGKEINNLTGYFAQFDQYIEELEKLTGQLPNTVSTTPTTNDSQTTITDTNTSTSGGDTAQ